MLACKNQSCHHQCRDRDDLHHHERTLGSSSCLHAETVDEGECSQRHDGDQPVRSMQGGQFQEVARKRDGYSRHSSRLNDEKQYPSVEKRDRRMISLAQIGVLAPNCRHQSGQLGPDKRPDDGDRSTENPRR